MRYRLIVILALGLAAVAGCTPTQYAQRADRSAYKTLTAGRKVALGEPHSFDVRYHPLAPDEKGGPRAIRVGQKVIPLAAGENQPLTLADCLEIALRNSRDFQDRKETLYSEALALANARREWNWTFLEGSAADGEAGYTGIEGGPSKTFDGSADLGLTFTQRFVHGAQLALGASLSLASDLLGMASTTIESLLEANLAQPLLRGAWRGLAYEDQYRRERDFLISVFAYERFTQTFAVDILTEYYRVLRQRDQIENEKSNIARLRQTHALTKVLVEGGQRSRIEQDQAEQNLLDAQIRLQGLEEGYSNALDRFKLTLGLPVAARMELDYPRALKQLNEIGPRPVDVREKEAIDVALTVRPDVLTEVASVRDARRDVDIAADAFLPQLDLEMGISTAGTPPRDWHRIRSDGHTRFARLTFQYDLDQTDNRDAYRNAMIDYDRAKRELAEFLDGVRLDVRESYRALLQSKQSHELQARSVAIAVGRRKLAALQQKEGQASARDVLEAEDALLRAQNGLTNALIRYTTTRLNFLADLGMLRVDEKGMLHERSEPFRFDRIRKRYPAGDTKRPDDEPKRSEGGKRTGGGDE